MQPGVEPLRIAKATHVEPRLEEGILDRIGRLLIVAQDQAGGGEQPIGPAGRQR